MDHFLGVPNRCPTKFTKRCDISYNSLYKLYEITFFSLYRVCQWCGYEYQYYFHGECP